MFIYFTRIFEKISSLEDGDNFNVTNLETCLKDTTNQYTALTDARPSDDELYSIKQFHPHQHAISEMLSHFSETVYTCTEALPDIRQAGAEAWKADDVACKVDQDSMDGHLRRLVQTRGAVTELFGLSEERTKEQARGMEIWLKQVRRCLGCLSQTDDVCDWDRLLLILLEAPASVLCLEQDSISLYSSSKCHSLPRSSAAEVDCSVRDWFQVLFPGQIRSVVAGYLEPGRCRSISSASFCLLKVRSSYSRGCHLSRFTHQVAAGH